MPDLSHVDPDGGARMVPVGGKPASSRRAVAEAFVRCSDEVLAQIADGTTAKGPVLETARLAGIQAAKRTDELVPLCHSLPLDEVRVDLRIVEGGVAIRAAAAATARTGVEMEALVAASTAALVVIDMGKAIDRAMAIERVALIEKTGGRRGDLHHPPQVPWPDA